MDNTQEKSADIIADIRDLAKHRDWHNHTGQSNRERVLNIADRLEAAIKREREAAEADALTVGGIVEAERHKPGIVAAVRKQEISIPAARVSPKREAEEGAHPNEAGSCVGTGHVESRKTVQIGGEISRGGRAEAKPVAPTAGGDPVPAKSISPGNAAAMREALEDSQSLLESFSCGEYGAQIREQMRDNRAALAAPHRNCDLFGGNYKMLHTAWWDWTCSPSGTNPDGTVKLTFGEWLLEIAEGGK